MIRQEDSTENWLKSLHGQEFRSVEALVYVYGDVENIEHPQAVSLKFSLSESNIIECDSDGDSIKVSRGNIVESDLEEFGREVIKDFSTHEIWSKFIGKRVSSSFLIESVGQVKAGIGFEFEDGNSIYILNLGDELFIFNKFDELDDLLRSEPSIVVRMI